MATIAELGGRVLRRLGIAIVAPADRPAVGAVVPTADIATRALRIVGVNPIAAASLPAEDAATITAAEIAARALREHGTNPIAAASLPVAGAVVGATEIAKRALRTVGVNPIAASDATAADASVVTSTVIATRALQRLEVVAADETPTALDLALVQAKVYAISDALAAQGLVTWGFDTVPPRAAEHYVVMAANLAAPSFGKPADMALSAAAMDALRLQALSGARGQTLAEAKVVSVHDELVAQGVVDWVIAAVPQAHAEDYAALTAAHMAPMFGRPLDGAVVGAIEARLRRAALSGTRGQAIALAKVTEAHDALIARGVISWAIGAIPMTYAGEYVALTSAYLAPVFGKPMDLAGMAAAEARLRLAALSGLRGQTIALEKVAAVHDGLNARGIVSWALAAIPLAQAENYALLAANLLAPIYGKPMADMEGAEARIRAASMLARAPALAEQAVLDVHTSLDARGKTRWTVFDIPDYADDPYVVLACNKVAPQFALPVDGNAELRALVELAQMVSLRSAGRPVVAEYF